MDGAPTPLTTEAHELSFPDGQGGLKTLRLAVWFSAPLPRQGQLAYHDDNYPDRLGWKEVVGQASDGGQLEQASVPATDVSHELTVYPEDMLSNPLDVRDATIRFTLVGVGAVETAPRQSQPALVARPNDAFAELVSHRELSAAVMLTSLLLALGLGAAHALSPGHGKAMVAAYLVGSRGTWRHAVFLGLTVTITHTAGVFALGLVTLYAQQYIVPEALYPWLSVLSGLLVVGIGASLVVARLKAAFRPANADHHHHHDHGDHDGHHHHHDHGDHEHHHGPFGPTHSHLPPTDGHVTWRNLLALGISGGLLPCPSALVVLLSAIALHRVAFGMLLIFAFSLGLASVLVAIGLALVYAGRFIQRQRIDTPLLRLLPAVSALVITLVGLGITVQALAQVGLWTGPTVLAWLNL